MAGPRNYPGYGHLYFVPDRLQLENTGERECRAKDWRCLRAGDLTPLSTKVAGLVESTSEALAEML